MPSRSDTGTSVITAIKSLIKVFMTYNCFRGNKLITFISKKEYMSGATSCT